MVCSDGTKKVFLLKPFGFKCQYTSGGSCTLQNECGFFLIFAGNALFFREMIMLPLWKKECFTISLALYILIGSKTLHNNANWENWENPLSFFIWNLFVLFLLSGINQESFFSSSFFHITLQTRCFPYPVHFVWSKVAL